VIDSRRYLAALRQWFWLPLVGVLAAAPISYAVAQQLPRVYEARATLLVNFTAPQAAPTYNDALLSQQLVKTYTQMVIQPIVLEQVGPRLGLNLGVEPLERLVSAQPVRDTQLFAVTARSLEPDLARDVANAVADIFIAQQNQRFSQNAASSAISVIQPARLPLDPVEPKVMVDVAFASILVLLLMLGLVYLLARVDDTIKTAADAERAAGLPTLGVVPEVPANHRSGRVTPVEAFRLLRTALDFASARQPVRTLLVTSAGTGEGKSFVAASLAVAVARTGRRVIAVDADLRTPSLHRQFALPNDRGLAILLEHEGTPEGGLAPQLSDGPEPTLRILTAGPGAKGATELLQSPQFARLLEHLYREADLIVLDSPPTLAVADALVLAGQADAALLVVAANATQAAAARRACEALAQSGTRLLGIVLNWARGDQDDVYAPLGRRSEVA
jgi:capsular exopolysaccharide synthesis family protein